MIVVYNEGDEQISWTIDEQMDVEGIEFKPEEIYIVTDDETVKVNTHKISETGEIVKI